MDYHFLLQRIFPTQVSNANLLHLFHCRWILYLLSHQGSPECFYVNVNILVLITVLWLWTLSPFEKHYDVHLGIFLCCFYFLYILLCTCQIISIWKFKHKKENYSNKNWSYKRRKYPGAVNYSCDILLKAPVLVLTMLLMPWGHFCLLLILHYADLSIPLSMSHVLSNFLSFVFSYNVEF